MKLLNLIMIALLVTSSTFSSSDYLCADEVILDDRSQSVLMGDFDCAAYHDSIGKSFPIDPATGDITTGQLWKFFHNQGIQKMDRMVICLDVSPLAGKTDLDLESIELNIQGALASNCKNFSLDRNGDNTLILPSYGASSFEPEAQLEIELGYDFMTKFSESSTEVITLNYTTKSGTAQAVPKFALAGRSSLLSAPNLLWLGLFVLFWIVVFVTLFKFTKPNQELPPVRNEKALSA